MGGAYDDHGADDGDGSHGAVGDGVLPVGVADGAVAAVDPPLVRPEPQSQDGRRQGRCGGKGGRR